MLEDVAKVQEGKSVHDVVIEMLSQGDDTAVEVIASIYVEGPRVCSQDAICALLIAFRDAQRRIGTSLAKLALATKIQEAITALEQES